MPESNDCRLSVRSAFRSRRETGALILHSAYKKGPECGGSQTGFSERIGHLDIEFSSWAYGSSSCCFYTQSAVFRCRGKKKNQHTLALSFCCFPLVVSPRAPLLTP